MNSLVIKCTVLSKSITFVKLKNFNSVHYTLLLSYVIVNYFILTLELHIHILCVIHCFAWEELAVKF